MYNLGLASANKTNFEAALKRSGKRRITITIRDHDEKKLTDLQAPQVLDGSVQVDATAAITRSLSLTCLDPNHKLQFDANSPAQGALYADNFVSVEYGVYVKETDTWVDVPVFWGPISKFNRKGAEVTIEGMGKESLGLDPHLIRSGYTIPKGTSVANAVRNVMDRLGETRYNLEGVSGKLHKHRATIPGEQPWQIVAGGASDSGGSAKPSLVSKMGGHASLYYNGFGRLTHRSRTQNAAWVFTMDHVTDTPGFEFDVLAVRNHVEVKGGMAKHGRHQFRGHATLPDLHPLSPYALRRNGAKRYMVHFEESDSLKSDAACRTRAQEILNNLVTFGVTASFSCLPIPHLEEWDKVALNGPGYSFTFALSQFTIPLTVDSEMSVGFTKQVSMKRRHRRRSH